LAQRSGEIDYCSEYRSSSGSSRAYRAVYHRRSTAGDLAALDSDSALRRRLRYYAAPALLVIDEVGYLSYSNRHADLLFRADNRRHEQKSTLVTTNKSFAEWSEVFPMPRVSLPSSIDWFITPKLSTSR